MLFGIDVRYWPHPLTLPQHARKKYRRPCVKSVIRQLAAIVFWKLFHSFTSRSPTILLKSARDDHWTENQSQRISHTTFIYYCYCCYCWINCTWIKRNRKMGNLLSSHSLNHPFMQVHGNRIERIARCSFSIRPHPTASTSSFWYSI